MIEEWRPIRDVPGYEASDLGRVRSLDRTIIGPGGLAQRRKGRILRPSRSRGYEQVSLVDPDHRVLYRSVHRLVMETFVGPRPPGNEVRHRDGVRDNNQLSNLSWGTHSSNELDKVGHGTNPVAKRTSCPRGHRLEPPNLAAGPFRKGWRSCLACSRGASRVQRLRERGLIDSDLQTISDVYYREIMRGVAE